MVSSDTIKLCFVAMELIYLECLAGDINSTYIQANINVYATCTCLKFEACCSQFEDTLFYRVCVQSVHKYTTFATFLTSKKIQKTFNIKVVENKK